MPQTVSTWLNQSLKPYHSVVIFGLGREGDSTYTFLRQYLSTIDILLIDDQELVDIDQRWQKRLQTDAHLQFSLASQALTPDFPKALIFQSPGVPLHHSLRLLFETQELVVTSNTELCLDLLKHVYPHLVTIGVTGTKGKSTTTSLIFHLLKTAQQPAWLGGNIGVPPLDLLREIEMTESQEGYVVLELSSHQLDLLHISPQIAVIQNIVPEHLDYYGSFERYVQAKSHITFWQTADDVVITNPAWVTTEQLRQLSPGHHLTFTTSEKAATQTAPTGLPVAKIDKQQLWLKSHHSDQYQHVLNADSITLKGTHNLENILPAVALGYWLHLTPAVIAKALLSFKGLPHRLELVAGVNNVNYYNDSLATVQDATIAALKSFGEKPIILIAGGYDRGLELDELAKYVVEHPVKSLILFPTTGARIITEIEHYRAQLDQATLPTFPIHEVTKMAEAVRLAAAAAEPGDVVLMSPAAASFNLFKDYQDRGDQFKQEILKLAKKQTKTALTT